MLKLRVKPPGGEHYEVELERLPVMVGRSTRSALRLDDPFASRLHAELARAESGLRVSDLGSGNGTYLNGRRIGTHAIARPGDRIQIGNTAIEVVETTFATEEPAPGEFVARPQSLRREPAAHRGGRSEAPTNPEAPLLGSGRFHALVHGQALFEVLSQGIATVLGPADLAETFDQVLELLFSEIAAERAFLLLKEGPAGELACKVASYRQPRSHPGPAEVRLPSSIVAEVVGEGRPVLTADARIDPRFKDQSSVLLGQLRSVMAVPIALDRRVLGMIYVDSPVTAGAFGEGDLQLLQGVAAVAAVKIENAILLEEKLETERLRQQLVAAREIQRRLLPAGAAEVPGYELAGGSSPSGEVGGDCFDFLPQGDRLLLALGDVSGKGLDAALLMSSLHASLRAHASTGARGADLLSRLNRFLHASSPENRFATLFVGELDPVGHRLRYVNAGHERPLLVRAGGGTEELAVGGPPLGLIPAAAYEEGEVALAEGDVLVVFSDGVSEATDAEGAELGTAFISELVGRYAGAIAGELHLLIEQEVRAYAGSGSPSDDRTLVVLRRAS